LSAACASRWTAPAAFDLPAGRAGALCGFSPALRAGRRRTGVSRSITSSSRSLVVATASCPWSSGWRRMAASKNSHWACPSSSSVRMAGVDTGAAARACRACLNSVGVGVHLGLRRLGVHTRRQQKVLLGHALRQHALAPGHAHQLGAGGAGQFLQRFGAVWAAVIMRSACSATAAAEALEGAVAVRVLSTVYCFCTSSSWRLKSAGHCARRASPWPVGSAGLCLLAHLGQHIQRRQGHHLQVLLAIGLGHALRQRAERARHVDGRRQRHLRLRRGGPGGQNHPGSHPLHMPRRCAGTGQRVDYDRSCQHSSCQSLKECVPVIVENCGNVQTPCARVKQVPFAGHLQIRTLADPQPLMRVNPAGRGTPSMAGRHG
jgi:hypothetical protein